MNQLYRHPDGHSINIHRGMLTSFNAELEESASVPIGQIGLRELGERLIELAKCERTAGDCAEESGSTIASAMLNDMLAADSQAKRIRLLQSAVLSLAKLPNHERAAGGFAVYLTGFVELGLAHAPRGGSNK